jgi:hypothetical protein
VSVEKELRETNTLLRMVVLGVWLVWAASFTCARPAHAAEFYGCNPCEQIVWTMQEAPHYAWTPATGNPPPDGYEVIACGPDQVCHHYITVDTTSIYLSKMRWNNALRLLKMPEAWLRVRAYRGDGVGPWSPPSSEGIGLQ